MQQLGINHLEVRIVCGVGAVGGESVLVPIRVMASNPTGYAVRAETYYEVRPSPVARAIVGAAIALARGGLWRVMRASRRGDAYMSAGLLPR